MVDLSTVLVSGPCSNRLSVFFKVKNPAKVWKSDEDRAMAERDNWGGPGE